LDNYSVEYTVTMRKLSTWTACICTLLLLLSSGACKSRQNLSEATIEEPKEAAGLQSFIHTGDSGAASQLLKGFYDIEAGSWRWTARNFSVLLAPPKGAAEKGARLVLRLTVPEPVAKKLGSVTLRASIEGVDLPPETFSKEGQFDYVRDVPPQALAKNAVTVDFALDKSLPPSGADQRELGIVATAVGFEAK